MIKNIKDWQENKMNSLFMLIFITTSCVSTHQSWLNIVYAIELKYLLALKSKRLIHGPFHLTSEYLISTVGFSIFPVQWPGSNFLCHFALPLCFSK